MESNSYLVYLVHDLRESNECLRKQLDRLEADAKPGMDEVIRIRYLSPDGKDLTCYTARKFLGEYLSKLLYAMKCNILEVMPTEDSKICMESQENWVITWISVYTKLPEDVDATYLVHKANGEIGIVEYFYSSYDDDNIPMWTLYQNQNAEYIYINDKSDNRIVEWSMIPSKNKEKQ